MNKWKCVILIIISSFFGMSNTFGQGAIVSAKLDASSIQIGEQLYLSLSATFAAQDTVVWPILKDSISKNIEILEVEKIDTTYDERDVAIKTLSQKILITSFDSGYFPIPPQQIIINNKPYFTEALLLQVNTVPIDTAKGIYDIAEPLPVAFSLLEWLMVHKEWVIAGLVAVLAIILILYFIKNRKNKPIIQQIIQKPKIPAEKIAIKKLNELKTKNLWQNGKAKAFHSELSEIIRTYIEDKFEVNALEQTSNEIILTLKNKQFDHKLVELLSETLTLSDMVKFAKAGLLGSEHEKCLENCIQFVLKTSEINKNE
jgi:hypothetical protein